MNRRRNVGDPDVASQYRRRVVNGVFVYHVGASSRKHFQPGDIISLNSKNYTVLYFFRLRGRTPEWIYALAQGILSVEFNANSFLVGDIEAFAYKEVAISFFQDARVALCITYSEFIRMKGEVCLKPCNETLADSSSDEPTILISEGVTFRGRQPVLDDCRISSHHSQDTEDYLAELVLIATGDSQRFSQWKREWDYSSQLRDFYYTFGDMVRDRLDCIDLSRS